MFYLLNYFKRHASLIQSVHSEQQAEKLSIPENMSMRDSMSTCENLTISAEGKIRKM